MGRIFKFFISTPRQQDSLNQSWDGIIYTYILYFENLSEKSFSNSSPQPYYIIYLSIANLGKIVADHTLGSHGG